MLGHLIAEWMRALRIATKSLGQPHGSGRLKPEGTGVVDVDKVANPFSYIVTSRSLWEGEVGAADKRRKMEDRSSLFIGAWSGGRKAGGLESGPGKAFWRDGHSI